MSTVQRLAIAVRLFGLRSAVQIVLYPLCAAYNAARFSQPQRSSVAVWLAALRKLLRRPTPPAPPQEWTRPGAVQSYAVNGRRVTVACQQAHIHIAVLAADLMRVQLQRPGEVADAFSYAVDKPDSDWSPVKISIDEKHGAIQIATSCLVCRVDKPSSRITFLDPQRNNAVVSSDAAGFAWQGARVSCSLRLAGDEHIYGLGEKAFGLDRRGHVYEMWNADPSGAYAPGHDPLYLNIPFYVALRGESAYGLFFDNTYRSSFDMGATNPETIALEAAGGPMCYYFFQGPKAAAILERYTELTGRLRLPPLWALGYQQSRWSYSPDSTVRELARQFRSRRIPCDVIHLDIDYMDGFRDFTWHPRRFPDPAGLVKTLHDQGFRVVPLIDCGVKKDDSYAVYRDGLEQKVFSTLPSGQPFVGPVWPGDCCFPDFTSPRVREWWGRQHQSLVDTGVDGIWNDMNEPTVMGWSSSTLPDYVCHNCDGRAASHAEAHNVYGLEMARATAEGLQTLRPDRRPFVMTRAGWAGLQRYAINWMGDNVSSWEHLRLTTPMIANLGLCGLAFTGPDTGGFAGDCTPELLTRWLHLGVFTPFFRNHAAMGTARQEPWAHGEPYEGINRRSLELRYHVLPYLYTAFWQCSQTGLPMVRPLFLDWQQDQRTHTIEDEFMFGDALLVAPVGEAGATRRQVYLPAGTWYDWWSGQRLAGEQTVTVDAPLDRIPLFARAGSIVPGWPIMQYTGERPVDVLTLHVFPGNDNGDDVESVLYEDDGQSMAYLRGESRLTRFVLRASPGLLTVDRQAEGPFEPGYNRVELNLHGIDNEAAITGSAGGEPITGWQYDAASHTASAQTTLAEEYRFNTQWPF